LEKLVTKLITHMSPKKIKLKNNKDNRGFFLKLFCKESLSKKMNNLDIKQVNYSFNKKKGTIRGLHYQANPYSDQKFLYCLKGKIFDVIVDIRKSSKNYLKYKKFILDEKKNEVLIIPKGFAHGFQTLTNNCKILYFHSGLYKKKYENGINPMDSKIKIDWPIKKITISKKDKYRRFL